MENQDQKNKQVQAQPLQQSQEQPTKQNPAQPLQHSQEQPPKQDLAQTTKQNQKLHQVTASDHGTYWYDTTTGEKILKDTVSKLKTKNNGNK